MTPASALLLACAAFAGGAVNAVAGGGTLVTFPAAIAAGLPPLVANATNAVAMAPAALSSAWAYRREVAQDLPLIRTLAVPALIGGLVGAALLLSTPARIFDTIVPLFVLGATTLLFLQNLRGAGAVPASAAAPPTRHRLLAVAGLTLAISIYGGYFGAGMGLLMLAALGLLGAGDVHRQNGVRSVVGAIVNGVAAVWFLASGAVDGRAALVMASGASLGGWAGAAVLRKVPARTVRWIIVALGAVLAGALAWRRFG